MRRSEFLSISSIWFSLTIYFSVSANQHFRLKSLNHSNRKHAKVREVASLKIVFGRGRFFGPKVWKGQVYGKPVLAEVLAR